MKCKWCNNEIDNNSLICPYCGNQVNIDMSNQNVNIEQNNNSLNNEINENIEKTNLNNQAMVNNITNEVNDESNSVNASEEKVNVGLAILSWFIPIVGFILFFVKKEKEPKTAKVSGICALVSFLLGIIISVILVSTIITTTNFIVAAKDSVNQQVSESIDTIIDNTNEIIQNEIEKNDNNLNSEADENNVGSNASSDWKRYELVVNGKMITLPTDYNTLSQITGFKMKSADEKSYLDSNYYTLINLYKNDKLALYIEVLNDSDIDSLYIDSKITRISQTNYQVSNGADVVYFPGGLKVGDSITEERIVELFGEPNDKHEYSSEGYNSVEYSYFESLTLTTTNNYKIKILNGIIDELQLDKRISE